MRTMSALKNAPDIIQTSLLELEDIQEAAAPLTRKIGKGKTTMDDITMEATKKKRGRPAKKQLAEGASDQETKKRGRPPKANSAGTSNAVKKNSSQENSEDLVFALDIGTRSVIGIVAEDKGGVLNIIATEHIEHRTRAMLDGQIHDVPQVAAIINEVKEKLAARTGTLKSAAVAAAGRALYTMTAEASMDVTGLITAEEQRDLDFAGVQSAQRKLATSQTVEDHTRYYCVGYSTISYSLDDNELKTLVGQRGRKAKAKVIATFLPRQVVDSMQSALHAANLDMRALTLEPIAGINVLIPPTMRHLNLTLVDIGAGTSDVAITRNGSVVAYGMVPMAGDEVTEALSREYLLDFNVAEDIKRNLHNGEEVSFTDILGASMTVSAETVLDTIRPTIRNLAEAIAEEIIKLNGESPQAVMIVGGGALTPILPELVAKALNIQTNRVAVRYPESVEGIAELPEVLKVTDAVTPLGILKIASINTLHFLAVWINDVEYSLFNFRELTVSDALLAAGIGLRKYNGRPGLGLMIVVNGKKRTFPGTMGSLAEITIDDKKANLDTPIYDDCHIKITTGEDGTAAEIHLSDVVNIQDSYTVILNDEEVRLRPHVTVNGDEVEGDQLLKDNDEVKSRSYLTLGEVLQKEGLPPTGKKITYSVNGKQHTYHILPTISLNGKPEPISTTVNEGDVIEYLAGETPKIKDVLKISEAEAGFTIIYEGAERQIPSARLSIIVNGHQASAGTFIEDGAVIEYSQSKGYSMNVSEALLAVGFEPPSATSRVTFNILVNGKRVDFTSPINNGDSLAVEITPIGGTAADSTNDGNETTATTALSSVLRGNSDSPSATNEEFSSADGNSDKPDITIESLMRYD